ncbi:glycosyltransferase family 2 protein [Blastococcus saxobsidens]|uniref:Glycosyltransferase family 2 protein n=1 Tax=Blastococcus saxobsidens TaxID=138336 RepID=A0A6L9VWZ7_9ACTN|nr:glycosyltransferase [Blastococcus saxobsidens]NEK84287.1 glycosyltransferase family 2 protein [Blastococcus saxobsidens]
MTQEPATRPSLTVVIATLGRPEPLTRALDALAASTLAPLEVLVVDGDENRGARSVVAAHRGRLVSLRHVPAPRGLTRQRNVGLDEARGDVVLFLDDDVRVRPDTLERLLTAYREHDVVGATGCVVEPASNRIGGKGSRVRILLRGRGRDGTFTRAGFPRRLVDESVTTDIEFMQGAFMSARTSVARQVRFDERITGYGLAEDEDFSCRLSRRGRIRYLGDVPVEHDNAGFHAKDRRAFGHQVVRNRSYLFEKNFPQSRSARARFALMLVVLVIHRLLNRDVAGARGLAEEAWRRPRPARPYGENGAGAGATPAQR